MFQDKEPTVDVKQVQEVFAVPASKQRVPEQEKKEI